MICQCGNQYAAYIRGGHYEKEDGTHEYFEQCEECGKVSPTGVPDVYWDGKPEINLADDPETGKPRVFLSKGQKAQYLKERGLQEAGDKIRGSFKEYSRPRPVQVDRAANREIVRQALAKVRSMGKIYRRQEFLRIKKQAEKNS